MVWSPSTSRRTGHHGHPSLISYYTYSAQPCKIPARTEDCQARRPLNYGDSGWGRVAFGDLGVVKPGSAALVGVGAAGWPPVVHARGSPAPGCGCPGASGGGQRPGTVAAGEATADEVAQVQGSGAALEPGVVGGDAQVAQPQAAAATAGKLGDDAFHVGPVAPVVLAQSGVLGPVAAGLTQQGVVVADDELAAGLGGGAPPTQRAGAT